MFDRELLRKFVIESNEIERICTHKDAEIDELERFLNLKEITIEELEQFVAVYQPEAKLRDRYGMNVRVGRYYPPFGGPEIRENLKSMVGLMACADDAFTLHLKYEKLHPFMDGNGRSGRALWAWKMQDISDGFLKPFYFQTLRYFSKD